jgi:hypothetical protein
MTVGVYLPWRFSFYSLMKGGVSKFTRYLQNPFTNKRHVYVYYSNLLPCSFQYYHAPARENGQSCHSDKTDNPQQPRVKETKASASSRDLGRDPLNFQMARIPSQNVKAKDSYNRNLILLYNDLLRPALLSLIISLP